MRNTTFTSPRATARDGSRPSDRASHVMGTALVVLALLVVIVLPAITPPVVGYLLAGAIAVTVVAALAPLARRTTTGARDALRRAATEREDGATSHA